MVGKGREKGVDPLCEADSGQAGPEECLPAKEDSNPQRNIEKLTPNPRKRMANSAQNAAVLLINKVATWKQTRRGPGGKIYEKGGGLRFNSK